MQLELSAHALNRSAIGALGGGRCAEAVFLRDFRGRVCAVVRGDFASIDRGFSHERSASHTDDTPSRAHDRGYVGPQSRAGVADQPLASLQAVCDLARAISGDCDTG